MAGPARHGKDAVVAHSPKDPQFLSRSLNTGTTRYSRSSNPKAGRMSGQRAVNARANAAADVA
jgi:hypothetical protein